MRYVAQEGDQDCGVAVLAMLTGRTLAEAIDWLAWDGHPLKRHEMQRALWGDGYFLRSAILRSELADGEWFAPRFAPMHYAMVVATKDGHWTAIDGDGTLLDPWDRRRVSMADAYQAVNEIVGVIDPGPAR